MSISTSRPFTRLKLLAGTAAAALLIGWAAGVGAQTTAPSLPPIPQAKQQPQQPQALQSENSAAANLPAVPLGHDDVREVQNQLIALGFDPGAADGQIGPATNAAAQQYDQSRGGNGQVAIDGALLARLKADTAPRLTYEQVQERSHAHQQAQASPAAASNQFGSIVQQFVPLIGAAIANSNSNNNSYYGPPPGYYGPGYYGPPPGYW